MNVYINLLAGFNVVYVWCASKPLLNKLKQEMFKCTGHKGSLERTPSNNKASVMCKPDYTCH